MASSRISASRPARNKRRVKQVWDLVQFIKSLRKTADDAYRHGIEDGSSCLPDNAKTFCAAHPEETSCTEKYETGYRVGERGKLTKLEEAHRVGQQTKANGGSSLLGFSDARSYGPCRVQWLESFNEGYFGGPLVSAGK